MLAEWNHPGVPEGKLTKRWFGDSYFDLFVWLDTQGTIDSFQLCYDKSRDERALTWKRPSAYYHQRVDDGENHPGKNKSTPVLLPDGMFNFRSIAAQFLRESGQIESRIAEFVHQKILGFDSETEHA